MRQNEERSRNLLIFSCTPKQESAKGWRLTKHHQPVQREVGRGKGGREQEKEEKGRKRKEKEKKKAKPKGRGSQGK